MGEGFRLKYRLQAGIRSPAMTTFMGHQRSLFSMAMRGDRAARILCIRTKPGTGHAIRHEGHCPNICLAQPFQVVGAGLGLKISPWRAKYVQ
jgi:hypothetical protein